MLRATLRHDRKLVLGALLLVILAAWAWLWFGAALGMDVMDMGGGQKMIMAPEWTPGYAALIFLMWAVMMAAMMLPSAAPAILLVDALGRQRANGAGATARFGLGYMLVWTGFSLGATGLQWVLDHIGLLREDMSATGWLAGALLIGAGVYQWTALKQSCLTHCRAPFEFLTRHWRHGPLRAGLHHGVYCLGCCWVLMGLLFVGGLMNLAWIAALALLVLVEKLAPLGGRMSRLTGLILLAWGAGVIALAA